LLKKRLLREKIWYQGQFSEEGTRDLVKMFDFLARQPVPTEFEAWCKRIGWNLSGHGRPYPDCGKTLYRGCENVRAHPQGKVFGRIFRRTCMRKQCPVCYESWALAEAERSLIRFVSYFYGYQYVERLILKVKTETWKAQRRVFHKRLQMKLELLLHRRRQEKIIHWVISPPQDIDIRALGYARARTEAYLHARNVGFKGGCMVFHPFRLRCRKCKSRIDDYSKICLSCGSRRFEWYPSPHWHAVGLGWISHEGVGVQYKRSGWVVRNLGVRKNVFWTMGYLLSHAGVFNDPNPCKILSRKRKFHVTTWFGILAYSKLSVPKIGSFPERCPYCQHFLKPLDYVGLDRPPPEYDVEDSLNNEFLADRRLWSVHYAEKRVDFGV